jgi:hypothetical protein
MNWKRVWIGAALASVVLFIFDLATVLWMGGAQIQWARQVKALVGYSALLYGSDIVSGFLLSWLYVLARPRLGPGPRTAIVMGSVAFGLMNPLLPTLAVLNASWSNALLQVIVTWLKCVIATYVAGWQYIEKAPE